jgi:uncharacterized damage-inducible protein DinB
MTDIERAIEQMQMAFHGGAWHGPALTEILNGVSSIQAAARPIPNAHSIWEIVLHITEDYNQTIRRMNGDSTPITPELDWPTVHETSDGAWAEAINALKRSQAELIQMASKLDDSKLHTKIIENSSTYYVTFQGTAQHDCYHAGQIALLKKF